MPVASTTIPRSIISFRVRHNAEYHYSILMKQSNTESLSRRYNKEHTFSKYELHLFEDKKLDIDEKDLLY